MKVRQDKDALLLARSYLHLIRASDLLKNVLTASLEYSDDGVLGDYDLLLPRYGQFGPIDCFSMKDCTFKLVKFVTREILDDGLSFSTKRELKDYQDNIGTSLRGLLPTRLAFKRGTAPRIFFIHGILFLGEDLAKVIGLNESNLADYAGWSFEGV